MNMSFKVKSAVLCVLMAVGGCTSTSDIDTAFSDIAPAQNTPLPPPAQPEVAAEVGQFPTTPSARPATVEAVPTASTPSIAVRKTGAYPNINVEPEPSLQQIGDAESAQLIQQMTQLKADHASGRISTAQYNQQLAFLQRLSRTHSSDSLKKIGAL